MFSEDKRQLKLLNQRQAQTQSLNPNTMSWHSPSLSLDDSWLVLTTRIHKGILRRPMQEKASE